VIYAICAIYANSEFCAYGSICAICVIYAFCAICAICAICANGAIGHLHARRHGAFSSVPRNHQNCLHRRLQLQQLHRHFQLQLELHHRQLVLVE
jgi:hypothetical protein